MKDKETRAAENRPSTCQEPYTEHRYHQHPERRDLFVCAHCGDDLECACAMTESSFVGCEVHGYDGIEL